LQATSLEFDDVDGVLYFIQLSHSNDVASLVKLTPTGAPHLPNSTYGGGKNCSALGDPIPQVKNIHI